MKPKHILLLAVSMLLSCVAKQSDKNPIKITWTEVDSIPVSFGNISKGVSAAFVGLLDEKLIVSGGCNFPDTPAAEGGKKVFYNDILCFDGSKWSKIGELPYELAYGISIQLKDALLCIGGRNNEHFSPAVYRISFDKQAGKALVDSLLPMSVTIDNAAGALLHDSVVYIVGGNQNKIPSNRLWKLNLKRVNGWQSCSSVPARSLLQPALASFSGGIFLFGGYDNASDSLKAEVSQAVWKFSPINNKWQHVSDYPSEKEHYSLSGGIAVTVSDSLILTFSGVNKRIFEDALNRNFILSKKNVDTADSSLVQLQKESGDYLLHPADWYKFNSNLMLYNATNDEWQMLWQFPQAALAGASVAVGEKIIYVVNGETKPGIRTPKIWKIKWK